MRSYHSHVETLLSGSQPVIPRKPAFRASAIFPVMQNEGIHSRVIFMGYWKAKRNIPEISCVATLRSKEGQVLSRQTRQITDHCTQRVELSDLLEEAGLPRLLNFTGSIEVEYFTAQNLLFPFPAVVVNYYGPKFSSAVHTSQRVYNDFDDMRDNSVSTVPESGFNIYCDEDKDGFFTLINGPEEVPDCTVKAEVFNHAGERLEFSIPIGRLAPYQTEWTTLSDYAPMKEFLGGQVGCAKIHFSVNWIYPRLIVGNYVRSLDAINITHSYYDCSDAKSSGDYWHSAVEGWHPSALLVPLMCQDKGFTNAYFYPIISPSKLLIDTEIYSAQGVLLGSKERVLEIESPAQRQYCLPFKEICRELGIDTKESLGGRIIARPEGQERVPARLKLGLDLGTEGEGIPCNVCTNLHPFNPSFERKPSCFRWAPVLSDQEQCSIWFLNSSPAKDYRRQAEVNIVFYRESDQKTLSRQYTIAPHGHLLIRPEEDRELSQLLQGRVGWFTATSDNPYLTTYYFAQHSSGMIGGDHGF